MDPIDVDEILEVNYLTDKAETVEVRFKNGSSRIISGAENPEIFAALNHWTPPTA